MSRAAAAAPGFDDDYVEQSEEIKHQHNQSQSQTILDRRALILP